MVKTMYFFSHLVQTGPSYLVDAAVEARTQHEIRVTEWGKRDPVFKVELKLYLKSQVSSLLLLNPSH